MSVVSPLAVLATASLALGLVSAPGAAATAARSMSMTGSPPEECPVTIPNGAPLSSAPAPGRHGSAELWVGLSYGGRIVAGPEMIDSDGSIGVKFPWWRGVAGQLTITGRRLDGPAPPLRADIPPGYGDIDVQASRIIFPTEGCWEVTGRVARASLTFVVSVVKQAVTASRRGSGSLGRYAI
jgi:hypothetical protein